MSSDPCHQALAQIEHIALATTDLERLCDFYRQLGAVVSSPTTDAGTGLRGCALEFLCVRLEVYECRDVEESAAGGEWSPGLMQLGFALGSADAVDELSRVLAEAGHRVLEPPHRSSALGRYQCVAVDPDGNRIKLTV